tara:strand:- start:9514 stop:10770 length:1257 start_codon:yes stop_codon:yes gene_type:complete
MPGVAITSTLPTVGSTVGPTWASDLISWCNEVEADLEAAVVPSEITVNQDFAFSNYKATGLGGVRFTPNTSGASSGASNSSMLEVAGDDLYFVDANGTSIQITSGGAVNVLSTGGIGGDYPSSAASVTYSNSNDLYTFSDDATPAKPAKMNCGQIQLRYESASSNAVTIKAPSGVATYNIIMPTDKGTGNQVIAGTTAGSDLTLAPTSTVTGQISFTGGIIVKGSSPGNTAITHFEEQGTSWPTGASTTGLGWTPVIEIDTLSASDLIYDQRVGLIQKIGQWVTVTCNIEFYQNSGSTLTDKSFKVTGLPYRADSGGVAGLNSYIIGMGSCAAFPHSDTITTPGSGGISHAVVPVIFAYDNQVHFMKGAMQYGQGASARNDYPASPAAGATNALPVTIDSGTAYRTNVAFTITYKANA